MKSTLKLFRKLLHPREAASTFLQFDLKKAFTTLLIVARGSIAAAGGGHDDINSSNPPANAFAVTKPILGCADIAKANFSNIAGAPASITSATVVGTGDTSYCDVKGTVTTTTNFEVRLPMQTYTQRF